MGGGDFNFTATQIVIMSAVGLAIAIAIAVITSILMCDLAEDKGYNPKERHIFVICLFLGVFGWIYTIALPDLYKREYLKKIAKSDENYNSQINEK